MINRLKEIRESKGFSKQDLAEAIGIKVEKIMYYENSHCLPDVSHIIKISEVLGVTVNEIYILQKGDFSTQKRPRKSKKLKVVTLSGLANVITIDKKRLNKIIKSETDPHLMEVLCISEAVDKAVNEIFCINDGTIIKCNLFCIRI